MWRQLHPKHASVIAHRFEMFPAENLVASFVDFANETWKKNEPTPPFFSHSCGLVKGACPHMSCISSRRSAEAIGGATFVFPPSIPSSIWGIVFGLPQQTGDFIAQTKR